MAQPSQAQVSLPRTWLVGLIASLATSLLLLAFLLGRMSAPSPPAPALIAAAEVPATPAPIPPAQTPKVAPTAAAPATPQSPPQPKFPPQEAAQIRQYLKQVDGLTSASQSLGDPSQFAQELLSQAMLGETGTLDQLLSQTQQALTSLRNIQPPPRCLEHYQLLREQVQVSLEILKQLKAALVSSDSTALAGLAVQGNLLQRETQRLDQLRKELQQGCP